MNVYITRLNGTYISDTAQHVQKKTAEVAYQIGCRELGIYRYNAEPENFESRMSRLDGIIAGLSAGDIVICQLPTWNGLGFDTSLIEHIKAYRGHVIIFIHDFEALMQEGWRYKLRETIELYNQAEVLIVASYALREFLLKNGIRENMKFVVQEIWDYPTDIDFIDKPALKKEIYFAGHAGKFKFMNQWDYDIPLNTFSWASCTGKNVRNMGWVNPSRLLIELAKGGFGLVWYGDEYWHQYMKYNNTTKLSTYLAAGIPVIVPRGISNQYLLEENHLGFIVDNLDEAVERVRNITEDEYHEYVEHVGKFAVLLRGGYFARKLITEAVHLVVREDTVKEPLPTRTYDLGEAAFSHAILNESYGGYLALSWDYKGSTDGFLIYNTSGELIGETENIYQHYFLIKEYKREDGFIVKAYIKTQKGKLVVAETKPVNLHESLYKTSIVSLVIPAYNAEKYVIRSIDSALAQSFTNLEIIIVNDGSTDGTARILSWYAEKYPNVIAIHQENLGAPAARNAGILQASGEYISFLDSDDMIYPDSIEKMYNAIKKNDCDIAVTPVYEVNQLKHKILVQYAMENIALTFDEFFLQHYIGECGYGTVIMNKLYKSSLVKTHLIPILLPEDEAWTPYILSYAERICYVSDCFYEYDRTVNDSSLAKKITNEVAENRFMNYKKAVIFYLQNGNPQKLKLLKELAKRRLLEKKKYLANDEYGKLWDEIDVSF